MKTSEYDLLLKNLPLIHGRREQILNTPKYYYSVVETGFCRARGTFNIGDRAVYLGSLLKAYDEIPELIIERLPDLDAKGKPQHSCTCGGRYLITGAVGSPLTGTCTIDCICPECGNVEILRRGGYGNMMRKLNAFLSKEIAYATATGLPLNEVIKNLEEGSEA